MGCIRLRLLDFPLERDEGEYAYAGQLILQGTPPYQECYNMKWPGTYVAYAAIMAVFGETTAGIHLGLLFVCLASALLVFLIGRRIGGDGMGAVAGATQALLSVNPSLLGLQGHATHFVTLFALAGIWVLMTPWENLRRGRCLLAGGLFGLACIMKQPGAVFGLFAGLWLLWRGMVEQERTAQNTRDTMLRLGFLAAGGVLSVLFMVVALAIAGVYGKFWHWTVEYARAYAGILPFSQGLANLGETALGLWAAASWLWLLAALGMVILWCEPILRRWRFFLVAFAAFSFAGVCPGLYFRNHYFLLLVPATSLLCGAAWYAASRSAGHFLCWVVRIGEIKNSSANRWVNEPGFGIAARGTFAGLFLLALAHSLIASGDVLFQLTPEEACRRVYGANPFPEAEEIARYIAGHCPPEARIAVLGSEPEIYFYSHRRAATGYIYTYPLMEPQPFASEMQRDMIREIENAAPEYLVFVSAPASWAARPESDPTLFTWMGRYCREKMELDGVVETLSLSVTESHWDMKGRNFKPRTNCWLSVYKRKPSHAPVTIHLNISAL
jgi:Dolichyl-phosphate-mannose-protein mannosyltransferase